MRVKRFQCGPLLANGYVLYQNDNGNCFIVDPGYEAGKYLEYVREHGLSVQSILLTHYHSDHAGQAEVLRDAFSAEVLMHACDAAVYRGTVDRTLEGGEVLSLDGEPLEVLYTPGHTKGGICLMAPKSRICFTGDTIFDTDLGRTDLAGGSEEDMRASCRNVVDTWENDIKIYPGHEGSATMKQVRKYNSEFLQMLK
ncbi:MAG: MBL fold metallo-hydrolase [Anaerovoracaceae bacterium]|jgi:hydroxyacylglutathione hydrolase